MTFRFVSGASKKPMYCEASAGNRLSPTANTKMSTIANANAG